MWCRAVSFKTDDVRQHYISIPPLKRHLQNNPSHIYPLHWVRSRLSQHFIHNFIYTAPPPRRSSFSTAHFFHREDEARNFYRNSINIYQLYGCVLCMILFHSVGYVLLLCLCILIVMYALLYTQFHRGNRHSPATLTEILPCFFLRCKANARVYLTKTGHGPHSS